jgi:hypothetical protein
MILGCSPRRRRPSIHWMHRTQLTRIMHIIRHHRGIVVARRPRLTAVTVIMCSQRGVH